MSKYNRVHQLGFVVPDMEAAMDFYGAVYGVKRWYRPVNEPQGELFFEGRPFSDPGYDMAIGYCGKTEIELITVGKVDNLYSRYLAQNPAGGLHHISFFVRNLDAWVEEYKAKGFRVTQNGLVNGKRSKCRFAYMTRPAEGLSCIVEGAELRLGRLRLPSAHRKLRLVREYWMRCIWRIWTQVICCFSSCCSFFFGKKRMRSC